MSAVGITMLFCINLGYTWWGVIMAIADANKQCDELRKRLDVLENKETEEG